MNKASASTLSSSTTQKVTPLSLHTQVSSPLNNFNNLLARFSPDDVYQKERMKCKERFNLLPTQKPAMAL